MSLLFFTNVAAPWADIVAVSAISCFEVAWLDAHARIQLPCSRAYWFEKALEGSGINLLPITPAIAGLAVDLPEHHSDPQDRIIIATALSPRPLTLCFMAQNTTIFTEENENNKVFFLRFLCYLL